MVAVMRNGIVIMFAVLLVISIVPVMSSPAKADVQKSARSSEKVVVAELFTATWCTYCPWADGALHELKAQYGDRLVVLAYHPDADDPFRNQDAVDRWTQYQNIAKPQSLQWGYPTTIFDGNFSNAQVGGSDATKAAYQNVLNTEYQKTSLADITAMADISSFPTVKIKATITANVNLQSSATTNYQVYFVVFESGIHYDATNGIQVHDFVVRDVLSKEALSLSSGSSMTVTRTFSANESWNFDNCSCAVFVQNEITTVGIKNMNIGQAATIVEFVKGASLSVAPSTANVLEGGSTQYSLTISNFGKLHDNYTLAKSGDASTWFSLSSTVALAPGQSTTMTLTVNVPMGTSAGMKTATITATSVKNPDVVAQTILNISVAQVPVYGVELTPATSTRVTISPGWGNFTFSVRNAGNMQDNFTLTYTSNLQWQVTINPQKVSLNPGASATISMNINVPAETSVGSYDFRLRATSENNATKTSESEAIISVESIRRGVSITPETYTTNVTMGDSDSRTFTLRNLGNIEDTYSLTIQGDTYGWGSLSRSAITLAAGATGSVTLSIAVPSTTVASSLSFKVRATSQGDSTVNNESEVIVVVQSQYTKPKISSFYSDPATPTDKDYVTVYATVTGDFSGQVVLTVSECLESGTCKVPVTYYMSKYSGDQYKSTINKFAKGSHVACNISVEGMDGAKVCSQYDFTVMASPSTNQTQGAGLCGMIVLAISSPFALVAFAIYRRRE